MFTKFKAFYAFMLAFFSADSLVEDGKINLTEEQKQKLQDALGEKTKLDNIVKAMNQELADASNDEDAEDQQMIDLKKEAMEMLRAHGLSQEDAEDAIQSPQAASKEDPSVAELLADMVAHNKKTDKMLEKLLKEPEEDTPLARGKRENLKDMHSKTHFLGTGKQWDAFEGRPWNQAAAGLLNSFNMSALSSVEVQKLNDDADLYVRETNSNLNSLERDNTGLPSFWPIRTNVDDKVADGNIVSGEISQARKKNWLPKNKQMIQPEESQIYPVQIDAEFNGYYLQEMLTSWISQYNKEGSQAYKISFVRYLIMELLKKARQEDRRVAINGVYVKTPDTATVAGKAINRSEGVIYKLWKAYWIDKKFKIANIGDPTPENIVDYVPLLIESNLKEDDKNQEGLVLYLSPTWLRRHKSRKRQLFGLDNNYEGKEVMEIENYPNVRFHALRDLEGSDFMFITDDQNIEIMENIPGEKSLLHFEMDKRIINVFGDYKFAPRFKHIGTKVKDTDPAAFKVQTVWCNKPPYIYDSFTQIYDDTTGEVTIPYSNVKVAPDWTTNITDILGTFPGQVVKIQGDTAASGNVVSTGNMTLDSNFALSSGGTLTLLVNADSTLTEIKRTVTPPSTDPENVTITDSIDATLGVDFYHAGGANNTLDEITNGFEGQSITVHAADDLNTLTVDNVAGNIVVDSTAVLTADGDYITLVKVDGIWTEVDRDIA